MSQVHTPYHFVPLSKWIYMPDWAHLVSHDVPFKDGYSGVIDYTLTNSTPLCVGGDQKQANGEPTLVQWAKDPKGNPVIPGSSLKGMIRNVLEIATFGKFSGIDDSHFAYRDVSSKSHYLSNVVQKNVVLPAWLKFNSNSKNWELTTCKAAKVKHSKLKAALGKTIKNIDPAVTKYKSLPLSQSINITTFVKEGKQGRVTWVENIEAAGEEGHLVFCNNRIKGMGQSKPDDYEFSYCFYGDEQSVSVSNDEINDKANKMFISHGEEQIAYLVNNQSEKGIPVFALFEKGQAKLHSLGLAKMPRVLYNHSATDLATIHQTQARTSEHYFDMSELMFGTLREQGFSLKSRVSFSDASVTKNQGVMVSTSVTLNGPKATFKGAYLEQKSGGEYTDYDNKNAKIAGWKRYVTQSKFEENPSDNKNLNVKSQLELLNINSQFSGKIVFHNLKNEELGALLWSLSLGKSEVAQKQYHGLGHGKSLGAGAVQLVVDKLSINANDIENEVSDCTDFHIQQFIEHMNSQHSSDDSGWSESVQLQNFLSMTNMEENKDRNLNYMALGDYQSAKNYKASLPAMTSAGKAIKRIEGQVPSGSLSFSKGRLAQLCTSEDTDDTWFNSEKQKQIKLAKDLAFEAEQAQKAEQEAQVAKQMDALPEEMKKVAQLQFTLEKAITIEAKREFNAPIEEMLNELIEITVSNDAAQKLYELVTNKRVCEYLNISNKKKLKPRKELITSLIAKYSLTVKS
ncbi:TIGR03986 family type III CRISPR-associated RAMP protein [Colwellia sp. 12G3]|uniref:TIGR03986 family type III CRISPR-associated RAMP protein n=1 Tax=Colwellia sp. 12G3 TaxID=2058299 RepID=UPI000C321365|nr:TIGR03986 family CRISPR-associated RAMP protein [Colwellia sp. 12G3]PKI12731.1 TIGR03986 family CRISPR-associated RAMP protein [Colwellia sp. 12G3]